MKNYFFLIIVTLIGLIFSYPIEALREHIKSGNLEYVSHYMDNLTEREINHPDFKFLNYFISSDGKKFKEQLSKINIDDLSGHLAPILLYKKGNESYLNNNHRLTIDLLGKLIEKYDDSEYINPAISLMKNSYLKLGKEDSAKIIHKLRRDKNKVNIVRSKKIPNNPQQKNNEIYTLQIGAFSHQENAQQIINKFKKTGLVPRIEKISVNNKTLYSVRHGFFSSKEEAKIVQSNLKSKHLLNSYLKKIN